MPDLSTRDVQRIAAAVLDQMVQRLAGVQQQHSDEPRLMTIEEAATYMRRSVAGMRKAVARGTFPCVRNDGRVMFNRADLDRMIEAGRE